MSAIQEDPLRYYREHLTLYCRQAAPEKWQSEHQTAMQCRDLEEYISIGLSLFDSLRERARTVQDCLARGKMEFDAETSNSFVDAYREWLKPHAAVESAIRWFESRNYQVAKANEFRAAVREISLHEFDVDKLIEAENDIRAGRGKSLAEAIHELQGHRSA